MPDVPSLCRLCLTSDSAASAADDDQQSKIVRCFGPADTANQTVADVLNIHFVWFKFSRERDRDAFVCQPCWSNVVSFHRFYQTVLHVYETMVVDFCADNVQVTIDDDTAATESKYDISTISSAGSTTTKQTPPEPQINARPRRRRLHTSPEPVALVEAIFKTETEPSNNCSADDDVEEATAEEPPAPSTKSPNKCFKNKSLGHDPKKTKKPVNTGKRLADDELLLRYMAMDCQPCGLSFQRYADINRHHLDAHDGAVCVLMCCGRRLANKTRALEHARWHENPRQFDCPHCEENLPTQHRLREHLLRKHATTSAPRHVCPQCPHRQYPTAAALRVHQVRVHDERSFECFDCHRSFRFLSALRTHVQGHRPAAEAPFVCAVCARLFKTRATCDIHYVTQHTSQPAAVAAQCPDCGAWQKNGNSLRMHRLRQHAADSQRPRACAECGHQAATKRGADNHRRAVHGTAAKGGGADGKAPGGRVVGPPVQHPCLVCGKTFGRQHGLRQHMAIHTGTDLFQCPYCPKTFRFDSLMYTHRKRVHGAELEADQRALVEARAEQRRRAEVAAEAERAEKLRQRELAAW